MVAWEERSGPARPGQADSSQAVPGREQSAVEVEGADGTARDNAFTRAHADRGLTRAEKRILSLKARCAIALSKDATERQVKWKVETNGQGNPVRVLPRRPFRGPTDRLFGRRRAAFLRPARRCRKR